MILDSSAVIALINPKDVHCDEVTASLKANPQKPRILHEVSLAECLVRSSARDEAGEVLRFMEIMGFEFQSTSGVAGALRVSEIRMKTKLPLPDCYVIDIAIRQKLPLISFDQKLNSRAQEMGVETVF